MRKVGVCLLIGVFCVVISAGIAQAIDAEWWGRAAAPYKGITIKGVSESTPPSKTLGLAIPEFERLTGIKVQFETTSWDEMYRKSMMDMEAGTGVYDFIYIEQDVIEQYITKNWVTDMTELMIEHPELTSADLDLADFTTFIDYFKDARGHVYGIPFEAFLRTYVYRTDLFADPEIRAAFMVEYGWDLRPAKNWVEYAQIAKFFTEWGKEKRIELYGHTAQPKSGHTCCWSNFCDGLFPSCGVWTWGMNMDNFRATVEKGGTLNSQKAKDAVRFFIDMLQYGPPGIRTYTWDEESASIASGKVAQGIIFCENLPWIATDTTKSMVTGKVATALVPTQPGIMDEVVRDKHYIAYYDGGAAGIPHCSTKKEAAWLFIQYATGKEGGPEFAAKSGTAFRKSVFASPIIAEADKKTGGLYTLMKDYGFLYAGTPRFPMYTVLVEICIKGISKAVSGELPPGEALDVLARTIDAKMEELGY